MPKISNVESCCQHYSIPYPMSRQAQMNLFSAVFQEHPDARYVGTYDTATCETCCYFDGCPRAEVYVHPRTGTKFSYTQVAGCKRFCPIPEAYLVDIKDEDLRFSRKKKEEEDNDGQSDKA